jgi:UDP-galactopyranose mutase
MLRMKILIIGAGLSGCTIARLLKDKGHYVSLIEKNNHVGGLCITRVNEDGLKYEPFGARTFHTKSKKAQEFITRFDKFNGYVHRKGIIINNKLFPLPITKVSINNFEGKEQIFQELENRPEIIDRTSFKTAAISVFGKTLYSYFIENYTTKMWGTDPYNLPAEPLIKRLELRETHHDELFLNQWQGIPVNGYSFLIEKIAEGIPIELNTSCFNQDDYDVVVSSAPLDQISDFKFGKLQYRSLRFHYKKNEVWENDSYGTINLPQHPKYMRKCNFKIFHKVESRHNLIQYQEPVDADNNIPMYPLNSERNELIFNKYLEEICNSNICPIGRLGNFKYLDMDKAIMNAFDMVPVVENYLNLTSEERFKIIKEIREKY